MEELKQFNEFLISIGALSRLDIEIPLFVCWLYFRVS